MSKHQTKKIGALLFIINASIYLTTEFIAAWATGLPLKEVYSNHFISALGVYPHLDIKDIPQNFSPLAGVMNFGFIVTGVGFFTAYYLLHFKHLKEDNKLINYSLLSITLIFSLGSIMVGIYQGGVPEDNSMHSMGAKMSFLAGNATLILAGIFLQKHFLKFKLISIILGFIGICAAFCMQYAITHQLTQTYMVIFERLTVYPITLWQYMSGIYFYKVYHTKK